MKSFPGHCNFHHHFWPYSSLLWPQCMVDRVINYNPPLLSCLPFVIRCPDESYIAVQTLLHRLSSWPGFDTSALITCIFKSVSQSLGDETRTPRPALLRQSVLTAPLRKSRFVQLHVKDSECIRVLLTRMLNKPVVERWIDFALCHLRG